nr:hypothetical protein [Tanacetum cinerariifolium]
MGGKDHVTELGGLGGKGKMWVRHGVEGTFVDVVASDSDKEIEDELEAHISESKEEFDDTLDDTSDNDVVLSWQLERHNAPILLCLKCHGQLRKTTIIKRAESTGFHAEAPKMLWEDLVTIACLIYYIPYVLIELRIPEEEWQGKDTSLAYLKILGYEESPGYQKQRYYIYGLDLRSQSMGWSSDTSEGSENSGSFKDSQRSDEKDLKTEHPPRREAPRLHGFEGPAESPRLR